MKTKEEIGNARLKLFVVRINSVEERRFVDVPKTRPPPWAPISGGQTYQKLQRLP
jgi:hypothetical protein